MISGFRISNFKCFRDITLPLGRMTILSGLNGMGKSSVIQALLLLRQSHELGLLNTRGLALNGDLIQLGGGYDALFVGADEDIISFEVTSAEGRSAEWRFRHEAESDVLPLIPTSDNSEIMQESLFGDSFHYLQAERTGPRTSFKMSDSQVLRKRQLGTRGEYCAHFLAAFEREDIRIPNLKHDKAVSLGLRDQVEAWIAGVSPGTRIHVTTYPGMDLVNLQFSQVTGSYVSDPYRATNVGFGLSYTLPLFVATLASRPGGMLMVENPEAHLHPRAQIGIAKFFARAAAGGIHVLLETHSDHVLNGVRLAVHDNLLSPDEVRFHFFRRADDDIGAQVVSPEIDSNGRIDYWPEDFFDQWEKSLDALLD